VAIVGPESSGKSHLARQLAAHFRCDWVPEFAREYLEKLGKPYTLDDVETIARGQIESEDAAAKKSKSLLICDTNLLVIKIWMEHKYTHVPGWIETEIKKRKYHLHLLTAPDIPYQHDPLRENPELGEYFFKKYQLLLGSIGADYVIIAGNETQRLRQAIASINQLLKRTGMISSL